MRRAIFIVAIAAMGYAAVTYCIWLLPPENDLTLPILRVPEGIDEDSDMLEELKVGLINGKGRVLIFPDLKTSTDPIEEDAVRAGCFGVGKVIDGNEKWGVLDMQGGRLSSLEWDKVLELNDQGVAPVMSDGKWGLVDRGGNVVSPVMGDRPQRLDDQGLISVMRDERWGWIDRSGEMKISPRFTYVYDFDDYGLALVCEGEKWGWIGRDGEYKIAPGDWDGALPFDKFGRAMVAERKMVQGKFGEEEVTVMGWIDLDGDEIIPPGFDRVIEFGLSDGFSYDRSFRFGDRTSFQLSVLKPVSNNYNWESLPVFFEGTENVLTPLRDVNSGKYGYVNRDGETVIPFEWDFVSSFGERDLAPVKRDGFWGWVDRQGNVVIHPEWTDAKAFDSAGMAAVEWDGKWGWIDEFGEVVMPPRWEGVESFEPSGLAVVEIESSYGLIDRTGQVLFQPKFDGIFSESGGDRWWLIPEWDSGLIEYFSPVSLVASDGRELAKHDSAMPLSGIVDGYCLVMYYKKRNRVEMWKAKFKSWLFPERFPTAEERVLAFRWYDEDGNVVWDSDGTAKEWSYGITFSLGLIIALFSRPRSKRGDVSSPAGGRSVSAGASS